MKLEKWELDAINAYIAGADKFLAIAKVKENTGNKMAALEAMQFAQEQIFDLKDFMNANCDLADDQKQETFAECMLRDEQARAKIRNSET